ASTLSHNLYDISRKHDINIPPLLHLRREVDQSPEERHVYNEGDSRLGYRDRGHREAADHRRLAVVDEYLVVGLLRLEREADVHRRGLDARVLGVHLHEHLAVGRHVWRHLEVAARLLEAHRGAG